MPAVGRRKGQARRIVPPAETEVDTSIKQLPGKGGAAAETVDCPAAAGPQFLVEREQVVERSNAVYCEGFFKGLSQRYVPAKPHQLLLDGRAAQGVQTALADSHNLRVDGQLLQALPFRLGRIYGPPGVNTD